MEEAGNESSVGGSNTNAAPSAPSGETTPPADGTAPGEAGGEQQQSLTPEQQAQADADKVAADKAAADAAKAKEGAPEKYEFKLPEGQTLHPDVQSQFEAVARELNMPQEAAQKLVEAMAPKIAAAQQAAFEQVRTGWTDAVKADPELGGDKLDANLAIAKKAMDRFGSPELKTYLNETGLGDNPELVRFFFKAGKAISEDKHVPGSSGNAAPRDHARTLYPNSK